MPEVSVIVCHHKGDFIYKFVESVKRSYGVNYEIIVVTSDDALALSGIKGCLVVNCYGGPAEKRNLGARLAKGEYLAFFDDDVEIDELCLKNLLSFITLDEGSGFHFGKIYNMEHRNRFDEAGGYLTWSGFIWSRAGQNDEDRGQYNGYDKIFAGKSASCIIDAKTFHLVGGFDEDFWILGEESDLAWRVWLSGSTVYFNPTAIAYHAFNTRFKPASEYYTSRRVHFNGCRNYITMLIKNLEGRNLWKILPVHCLIWFSAGIIMCLTGKLGQGVNVLKGLVHVVANLGKILTKRREVQSHRVRSDRELWPYIYRSAPRGYYTQRFLRYLRIGLHG